MKKLILPLLMIAVLTICAAGLSKEPADVGAVVQTETAAPLSSFEANDILLTDLSASKYSEPTNSTSLFEAEEQFPYNENVPLSYEEQLLLMESCKENDIPYALALGLIEKETNFRNVLGDDGASMGYMQIQERWHWDRMERLGVTDLLDPEGNFQVGCDFLSELYTKYEDWGIALTVYNMGHYPGYTTTYANDVLNNYASWEELVDIYE